MDYIDTNVLASYYSPDSGSDLAQKVLMKSKHAAISTLTQVELSCVVARKVRDGTLSRNDASRILALLNEHLRIPRIQLLPVRSRDFIQAQKWVAKFSSPLRVLDALHLAVAHSNNYRLLTADRELALAAKHFRVRCRFVSLNRR